MAATTDTADRVVTITVQNRTASSGDYTNDADGNTSAVSVTIPKGKTTSAGMDTLYLIATDDTDPKESEAIRVAATEVTGANAASIFSADGTAGVYVTSADIAINDMDPDITLTLGTLEVDEQSGATNVVVTAELRRGAVNEIIAITVAASTAGDGCTGATWAANNTLRIDAGASSGTVTVPVTASANINDADEKCTFSATITAPTTKAGTTGTPYSIGTAEFTIRNADGSKTP